MFRRKSHRVFHIAVLTVLLSEALALDWEACRTRIANDLKNKMISINDRDIFHLGSTIDAPQLTLPACEAYCGKGRTWYPDIGPILNTWLIPVLILISQMDVSPLDKRTYLVILHLLGDPIDSIYCLLLKVEAWSRCRLIAETRWRNDNEDGERSDFVKTLGTVLGGIEEIIGERDDPLKVYDAMTPPDRAGFRIDVAHELAKSRTDDIYRTCLAVALYFYQVASAFVTSLGGSASSPPGGRIGISMFMTYILPAILLSNLLGNFPSVYTCYTIIQKRLPGQNILELIDPGAVHNNDPRKYFESRPWSGGIYTFRPEKTLFHSGSPGHRSQRLLFFLAILPVLISTAVGMAIIWHLPPAGPNCRWFVVLGISSAYFLSTFATWFIRFCGFKKRWHWYLTLVKDFLVAVPSLFLLFASSSGLFNTCWCWSGVYLRGRSGARIGLNTEVSFRPYITRLYPALFGTCIGLQLLAFGGMWVSEWRGLTLMRWSHRRMAGRIQGPSEAAQEDPHTTRVAPQSDTPAAIIDRGLSQRLSAALEETARGDGSISRDQMELQPLASVY